MRNLIKLGVYTYLFMYSFVVFAQGDEDDNGDLEGNDPPAAPLNSKLIYLGIVAIVFAVYFIRSRKKQTS